MKKILMLIITTMLIFSTSHAADNFMGWNGPIDGSITDATAYHEYDLRTFKSSGFFSLQITTTGAGTLTITYELSNVLDPKTTDYVASGATAIVTGKAAGTAFYQWPVAGEKIFAKHIRLKLVATGAVVYTLYPNVQ